MIFIGHIILYSISIYISTHSQPIPNNYTQQSSIDLNSKQLFSKLLYSPDQASMAYKSDKYYDKLFFRTTIIDKLIEKTISQQYIFDFTYSPKGNKLYIAAKCIPTNICIYRYIIDQGIIDPAFVQIYSLEENDFYNSTSVGISASDNKVTIYHKITFYTFDITDQKNVKNLGGYTLEKPQLYIVDIKFHPAQRDLILIGGRSEADNVGVFATYNTASHNFTQFFNNASTNGIGMLNNGDIFLQSLQNQQNVIIYNFSYGNVSPITTVDDFNLVPYSIASSNTNIFAGVDYKFHPGTVKVFQLIQLNSTFIFIDKQNNKLQNNYPKVKYQNLNQRKYNATLLFSKKYNSNNGFSGISSDGNQIYLNKDDNVTISGSILRFRRCLDGQYQQLNLCQNCSSNCKACFNTKSTCTSCSIGKFYQNYNCVDCSQRYGGCQICENQTCTKCNQTAKFKPTPQNNKCVCSDTTVPINGGRQCQFCKDIITGCNKCDDSTNCAQCDQSNNFISDGKGKCKCSDNYILHNSTCLNCQNMIGCIDCDDINHCAKCNQTAKFELINDVCECISGYWFNLSKKTCDLCSIQIYDCQICSQDGTKCSSCKSQDRKLNQDKTKCVCQDYKYQDQSMVCQLCDPYSNCISCSNSSYCLICNQNKKYIKTTVNGTCVCQSGYFQQNNTCYLCFTPGCLQCTGQMNCTKCSQNSNFNPIPIDGKCECKDGSYIDNSTNKCYLCKDKMNGCLNCKSSAICTACDSQNNFRLNNESNSCQCADNYFLQNSSCLTCQTIINNCGQCYMQDKDVKCKQCKERFDIINNGCKQKQKQGSNDNNLIIIISVGGGCFIIIVVISCVVYKKWRNNKKNKQRGQLLHQQRVDQRLPVQVIADEVGARLRGQQAVQRQQIIIRREGLIEQGIVRRKSVKIIPGMTINAQQDEQSDEQKIRRRLLLNESRLSNNQYVKMK